MTQPLAVYPPTPENIARQQYLHDIGLLRALINDLVVDCLNNSPQVKQLLAQLLKADYLPLAGGVNMTGAFNLHGNADMPLQPTTLQQVLALLQSYVPPSNGGGTVTPAVPEQFDRTLYQGTVQFNPTNNAILAQYVTLDENVTWYAQWGKVAELKLRCEVAGAESGNILFPSGVPIVRLHGLGLFADDYHELVPVTIGTLSADPDVEVTGSAYPGGIRMVNAADWTQGYDFMMDQGFYLGTQGRSYYLRATTMLTCAMYFLNGECILDDPQYVQVG